LSIFILAEKRIDENSGREIEGNFPLKRVIMACQTWRLAKSHKKILVKLPTKITLNLRKLNVSSSRFLRIFYSASPLDVRSLRIKEDLDQVALEAVNILSKSL
jgi:hypothetical protein